jgi:DNA-binding NarL/FixJ family response regulator
VLSLPTLARLALGEGDAARAGQLLAEGLILAQQADDKLALTRGLEAVAALLGGRHAKRALRLAGAAARLREALGAQLTQADRDRLAQWQALALRQLGMPAYSMALAEGRRRALDDAVGDAVKAANATASLAGASPPASSLTRREQEVAACLERGMSNRQVAQALTISEGTARIHVQHVLDKLGLNSRVQVAEYVRRVHQAGHRS